MGDVWSSTKAMLVSPGPAEGVAASQYNLPPADSGEGWIRCNRQALLGTMISGYIHEINNPNNNILLASRLLAEYWKGIAPLLTEYQEHHPGTCCAGVPLHGIMESMPRIIAMIAEDVDRINRVTVNLKPKTAAVSVATQYCEPNAVIRAVVEALSGMIPKHTRHFRLNLPEEIPPVLADSQQLQQVVTNLICNALQSLPDRERSVTVSAAWEHATGNVVITVEDEGDGIAPNQLNQVFEPFYTTRPERGCTGLGLFVSRLIVHRYNGSLILSSELERGSTAVIRLPS